MIRKTSVYPRSIHNIGGSELLGKRLFDVAVSAVLLLLTLPLTAMAAIAILVEDGLPVLTSRTRIGQHGQPFELLRFRTMSFAADVSARTDEEAEAESDPTLVGSLLGFCRIDELPQLWNVLVGDISLVGPKPLSPKVRSLYARRLPLFETRHAVRPGLIGCGAGRRAHDASLSEARDMLSGDLDYVARQSLGKDLAILASAFLAPERS